MQHSVSIDDCEVGALELAFDRGASIDPIKSNISLSLSLSLSLPHSLLRSLRLFPVSFVPFLSYTFSVVKLVTRVVSANETEEHRNSRRELVSFCTPKNAAIRCRLIGET